jgi:hypothetical protein
MGRFSRFIIANASGGIHQVGEEPFILPVHWRFSYKKRHLRP